MKFKMWIGVSFLSFFACRSRDFNASETTSISKVNMGCVVEVDDSVSGIFKASKDVFKEKILTAAGCASALSQKNPDVIDNFMKNAGCTSRRRAIVSEKGQLNSISPSKVDPRSVDEWNCGEGRKIYFSGPGPAMHIIALDPISGAYNFYSADHPKLGGQIFFHGNSFQQAKNSTDTFRHPCTGCHIGGGLLMRELRLPWAFWHTGDEFPLSSQLAVMNSPLAKNNGEGLFSAVRLEFAAVETMSQVNDEFVARVKKGSPLPTDAGAKTLAPMNYKTLLEPLFCDKGVHFITSHSRYGSGSLNVPPDMVLNRLLVPEEDVVNLNKPHSGDLHFARFENFANIPEAEWKKNGAILFTTNGVQGDGQRFPFFIPTRHFSDDDLIVKLVKEGIISEEFALSVLLVDIQNPVFSAARCGLLNKVPALSVVENEKIQFAQMKSLFEKNLIEEAKIENRPAHKYVKALAMGPEGRTQFVKTYMQNCQTNFAANGSKAIARLMAKKLEAMKGGGVNGDDFAKRVFASPFGVEDFAMDAGVPQYRFKDLAQLTISQSCKIVN